MQPVLLPLLLLILLLPSAEALSCEEIWSDPVGDTEPPLLPGHYDLTGVRILHNASWMTWTWSFNGGTPTGVQYAGGFDIGFTETSENTILAICNFGTLTEILAKQDSCRLVRSSAPVEGSPVRTYELLAELNHSRSGNDVTTQFPLGLIGIRNSTLLTNTFATVQYSVSSTESESSRTEFQPIETDLLLGSNFSTCYILVDENEPVAGAPGPVTSTSAKGIPLPTVGIMLSLVLAVFLRRRA